MIDNKWFHFKKWRRTYGGFYIEVVQDGMDTANQFTNFPNGRFNKYLKLADYVNKKIVDLFWKDPWKLDELELFHCGMTFLNREKVQPLPSHKDDFSDPFRRKITAGDDYMHLGDSNITFEQVIEDAEIMAVKFKKYVDSQLKEKK